MHKLEQINEETKMGFCQIDGWVRLRTRSRNYGVASRWRCSKKNWYRPGRPDPKKLIYRQHLKSSCEKCGFIPEHLCQLDIHHLDGNHNNNDIVNLKTLCANCHRLESLPK